MHLKKYPGIFPFLILLNIHVGSAAIEPCDSIPEDFTEFASQRMRACKGDRSCLQIEVRAGIEQGLMEADCNCLESYLTLGLQLRMLGREDLARFETSCRVTSGNLHFIIGTHLLIEGQPLEALETFERALKSGVDSAGCYSNMGIAWMQLGNLHDAKNAFRQALDRTSKEDVNSLGLLVTLSGVHLQVKDPVGALYWSDRFEAQYSEMLSNEELIPALMKLAEGISYGNQVNRLIGHMDLNDSAYVFEHWNVIPWGKIDFPPVVHVQTIFDVADFLKSNQLIIALREDLEHSLNRISLEQAEGALGAFALLHPAFRERFFGNVPLFRAWDYVVEAKAYTQGEQPAHQLNAAQNLGQLPSFFSQNIALLVAITCLVFFLTSMALKVKQVLVRRSAGKNHFIFLFSQLKLQDWDVVECQRRLADVHEVYQTSISDWLQRTHIRLNPFEQQILFGICTGHSPKEMAKWCDMSVGHVYNVCSLLRTKLHVPEERQIKEWVDSELKSKMK